MYPATASATTNPSVSATAAAIVPDETCVES